MIKYLKRLLFKKSGKIKDKDSADSPVADRCWGVRGMLNMSMRPPELRYLTESEYEVLVNMTYEDVKRREEQEAKTEDNGKYLDATFLKSLEERLQGCRLPKHFFTNF